MYVVSVSVHTYDLHAQLNIWVKYRKYVIYVDKWSSSKTTNVGIGTGPVFELRGALEEGVSRTSHKHQGDHP